MRLLKLGARSKLSWEDFVEDQIPRYAILSHTWGADKDEVTFNDLQNHSHRSKAGFTKVHFCGKQARKDGIQYFWVDTCCIDKMNLTELSEAITSMFRWYQNAVKCYVYLSDVSARKCNNKFQTALTWRSAFQKSRWFTRGWTLQELLAPGSVEFFSQEEELLGNKRSLEELIHEITGVPLAALRGSPLSDFRDAELLQWAAKRCTKRKEDKAYCLLGLFDLSIPLLYGEGGEKAFTRLEKELRQRSKSKCLFIPSITSFTALSRAPQSVTLTIACRTRFCFE